MQPTDLTGPPSDGQLLDTPDDTRAVYETPAIERIGTWSALTLQQSVPVTPILGLERDGEAGVGGRYGES